MMKIYGLFAAAALLAGAVIVTPGLVVASARHDTNTQTMTTAKGDRLDIGSRVSCKQQSWPYVDRAWSGVHASPTDDAHLSRNARLLALGVGPAAQRRAQAALGVLGHAAERSSSPVPR